jgi:hypothetical protein
LVTQPRHEADAIKPPRERRRIERLKQSRIGRDVGWFAYNKSRVGDDGVLIARIEAAPVLPVHEIGNSGFLSGSKLMCATRKLSAQRCRQVREQWRCRIGIVKELSTIADRGDRGSELRRNRETCGVPTQTLKLVPRTLALLSLLVRSTPPVQVLIESVVVITDCAEPLVAREHDQRVDVIGRWGIWKRGWTTSTSGKVLQPLKERWHLRAFLSRFEGDSGCGQQALHCESLAYCRWFVLLVKGDLPNLGRRQLLWTGEVLSILGGTDVASG